MTERPATPAAGERVAVIAIIIERRAPAADTDAKPDPGPHPSRPDPDAKAGIDAYIRPRPAPFCQTLQEIGFELRRADFVIGAPLPADLETALDSAVFPHALGMAGLIRHDIGRLTDPGTILEQLAPLRDRHAQLPVIRAIAVPVGLGTGGGALFRRDGRTSAEQRQSTDSKCKDQSRHAILRGGPEAAGWRPASRLNIFTLLPQTRQERERASAATSFHLHPSGRHRAGDFTASA